MVSHEKYNRKTACGGINSLISFTGEKGILFFLACHNIRFLFSVDTSMCAGLLCVLFGLACWNQHRIAKKSTFQCQPFHSVILSDSSGICVFQY